MPIPIFGMRHEGSLRDFVMRRKQGLPAELNREKLKVWLANAHRYVLVGSDWVQGKIILSNDSNPTAVPPSYTVEDITGIGPRTSVTSTEAPLTNFFHCCRRAMRSRQTRGTDPCG